jgi:uncharacterized membrane protein
MDTDLRRHDFGLGSLPRTRLPSQAEQARPRASEFHPDMTLQDRQERQVARFLGWFSIGLGVAQVAAPKQVARAIGLRDDYHMMPLFGLREILSGVGILSQRRPGGWLWSRVGGDLLDLACLAGGMLSRGNNPRRLGVAMAAVAGVTLLDLIAAERQSSRPLAPYSPPRDRDLHLHKHITVNKSPEELYQFWKNFENFPQFMSHLESVERIDDKRSRWTAKAPVGTISWEAEVTDDIPNERVAWHSLPNSAVPNRGCVEFKGAPGRRGTEVHVEIYYSPPAGTLGATIAQLFGEEPHFQVQEDLRKFKQIVEAGEVATTVGQPTGRGGRTQVSGM